MARTALRVSGIILRGYRTGGYRKNAFVDERQAQRCVGGTCSGFLYSRLYEQGVLIWG